MATWNCIACGSAKFNFLKINGEEAPATIFRYKRICAGCERFITWTSKGESKYLDMLTKLDIERLCAADLEWMCSVVRVCMRDEIDLTPAQAARLRRIIDEHQLSG
jgi:hypothetical protein